VFAGLPLITPTSSGLKLRMLALLPEPDGPMIRTGTPILVSSL